MSKLLDDINKATPATHIAELEKIIIKQQRMIDRFKGSKFKVQAGKVAPLRKQTTIDIFIPDTHGAHIDPEASKAFLNDLTMLKVNRVFMLGDHLDCGGFLAQHHVIGTIPETEVDFVDDVKMANDFLDKVMERCPGAPIDYIEGNHERRIEAFIVKAVLGKTRTAKFMRDMFSPEKVLSMTDRGIRFISRTKCYDGLKIPGTIDVGDCLARHGKNCGSTACAKEVARFGCNVVIAHTHRMLMASKETARGIAYSWCFGCLAKLQPLYYDTDPTDWAHGYGIQFRTPGYGFITLPVPIVNGRSYLEPLLNMVRL